MKLKDTNLTHIIIINLPHRSELRVYHHKQKQCVNMFMAYFPISLFSIISGILKKRLPNTFLPYIPNYSVLYILIYFFASVEIVLIDKSFVKINGLK